MKNKLPTTNIWLTLQRGQHYAKTWPLEKKLNGLLPENRVIRATRFAIRTSAGFAVLILIWHLYFNTPFLPTLLAIIFALSFPLQGLWWLGKRSMTFLPETLLFWYLELRASLLQTGITLPTEYQEQYTPTYQDLAELLRFALIHSPQDFFDSL